MRNSSTARMTDHWGPAKAWLSANGLASVAFTLVVLVVTSIFVISFASLSELAEYGNISANVAWLWPVAVDGTILAATVVYFVARKRAADLKTFTLWTLVAFAIVSILGNVAHGLLADAGAGVAQWVRNGLIVFINLVPPVGLLLTVHILASLMTTRGERSADAAEPAAQPASPLAELTDTPVHDVPAVTVYPVIEQEPDRTPVLAAELDEQLATDERVTGDVPEEVTDEVVSAAEAMTDEGDSVMTELTEGHQSTPRLHAVERIPADPAAQVEWVVAQARAGHDVTKKALLAVFEEAGQPISDSTAQRRLREARQMAPEAFAA